MLEFMRKSANSIFIKAFLGLLILSFAAWGIGDIFRGRASNVVIATVGDSEISVPRFRAEFGRELNRMSQLFGRQLSREQALSMGLGNLVASRMAQEELINVGARDIGLLVSDATVVGEIKKSSEFKNTAGQFDRNIYLNTLSRASLTEDYYVSLVRANIMRQQFLTPLAFGVSAPKPLVETLYAHDQEQRTADVVRIAHAAIQYVPTPTDEDLATYHKDHSDAFMAPEYRTVTAVVLRADEIAKTIEVSEDDLQQAYDERAGEYVTPEKRNLRQILVNDEASAQKAAALLDGGKSLDEVAAEVGANSAMTDIGLMTSGDAANLSADIATAVFALPKGGHSPALNSPLGWHVFEVTDIVPGTAQSLDQVREELTKAVKLDQAVNVLYDLSNQLDDLLGGGQTFEEAAASLGTTAVTIPAVDAGGLTPEGLPAKAPYLQNLIAKAFELSEGQDSQTSETEDGKAFFVVRVDGVTAPALRPLDAVKDQVAAAWEQQTRAELAETAAEEVTKRLKAGESAEAIAKSMGFAAATTQPFTRDGRGLQNTTLPANLIGDLFTLNVGDVASAPGTGAHTVARLTNVSAAAIDPNSDAYQAVADNTLRALQNDLMAQMTDALQGAYGVTLNPTAINSAFGS